MDDNCFTSCDEDRVIFKKLNELENMSIEDLSYLLRSTNSSSTLQPSQECLIEESSLDLIEETPHEVVIPIQLDNEDMLIFNELVHQVECGYMNEITKEWESSQIELGIGSNVVHEVDEWYKVEFLEDITTLRLCDKFFSVPSLVFNKSFLTLEEISFFLV